MLDCSTKCAEYQALYLLLTAPYQTDGTHIKDKRRVDKKTETPTVSHKGKMKASELEGEMFLSG